MNFLLDHDVADNLRYLLQELGHQVLSVRHLLPTDASDATVLQFARDNGCLLITCNRDDFVKLASQEQHHGIIVLVRRRTRAAERAALLGLLEQAGESGLKNNINFA